jgi:hypothetical protein
MLVLFRWALLSRPVTRPDVNVKSNFTKPAQADSIIFTVKVIYYQLYSSKKRLET